MRPKAALSETHAIMANTTNIAGIGKVVGHGWDPHRLWSGLMSGKPAAARYPALARPHELLKIHDFP